MSQYFRTGIVQPVFRWGKSTTRQPFFLGGDTAIYIVPIFDEGKMGRGNYTTQQRFNLVCW